MNRKEWLALEKENSKVIEKFFADHDKPEYFFQRKGHSPANPNIASQQADVERLLAAFLLAKQVAAMTGGWLSKVFTPDPNTLIINTIHPNHWGRQPEIITYQVEIIASSAVCKHGQPLGLVDSENMPICGGCGSELDQEMHDYEMGQEAAQAERNY